MIFIGILIISIISGILVSSSSKKNDNLTKLMMDYNRCTTINYDYRTIICFVVDEIYYDTKDDLNFTIPDETDIATNGHVFGVKPIFYNWTINFLSKTSFEGELSIHIEIVEETNKIFINLDSNAINVSYDKISIENQFCVDRKEICVTDLTIISDEQLLIITVAEMLSANETYLLRFEKFSGSPLKSNNFGSKGLRLTSDTLDVWGINTIFQMRNARTVFPCFDHPNLKSNFQICIEHSSATVSLSNTVLDTVQYTEDGSRRLDCFQPTAKLPTYLVTVTLLGNFTNLIDESETPMIELYYPITDQNDTFSWEIYETRTVLKIIENATGLTFDLPRLGFINLNPNPFWGIENYGLISLESGFTRFAAMSEAHLILVHEIIHQWLGDVVTIDKWDEICLQEGLTSYLEWYINEITKFKHRSLLDKVRQTIEDNLDKDHSLPLIRTYNVTQEIVDHCFGKPPTIFHMIAVAFGDRDLWPKFLTILVRNYSFKNANLNDWVDILNRITGNASFGYMLETWFTEPGYPIIYAEMLSDEIRVEQKIFLNENSLNSFPPSTSTTPRMIPINFVFETTEVPETFIFRTTNKSIETNSSFSRWFLVDPDLTTFSRKIYSVENYLALIECYFNIENSSCLLNREQMKTVFSDFCFALNNDLLPWDRNDESFRENLWNQLFLKLNSLSNFKNHLQINSVCNCCLKREDDIKKEKVPAWHKDSCSNSWNKYCKSIWIINKLTEYNNY